MMALTRRREREMHEEKTKSSAYGTSGAWRSVPFRSSSNERVRQTTQTIYKHCLLIIVAL